MLQKLEKLHCLFIICSIFLIKNYYFCAYLPPPDWYSSLFFSICYHFLCISHSLKLLPCPNFLTVWVFQSWVWPFKVLWSCLFNFLIFFANYIFPHYIYPFNLSFNFSPSQQRLFILCICTLLDPTPTPCTKWSTVRQWFFF